MRKGQNIKSMKGEDLKKKSLYFFPLIYLFILWVYIFQNSQLPSRDEGNVISNNKLWIYDPIPPIISTRGSLLLPFLPLFRNLNALRLLQFIFLLLTTLIIYCIDLNKRKKIFLVTVFVTSLLSLPWLCESNFYPFFVVILFALYSSRHQNEKLFFILGLASSFAVYFKFLFLYLLIGISLSILLETKKFFPYLLLGVIVGMIPLLLNICYSNESFFFFSKILEDYFTKGIQYDGIQKFDIKIILESTTLSFFRDFHQYFPTESTLKNPIYSKITKTLYYFYFVLLLILPFFIERKYLKRAIFLFYIPYILWLFLNPISAKNVHMTLFFTLFLLVSISYCKDRFLLLLFVFSFLLLIHQQWVIIHLFDEKYFTVFSSYKKVISGFLLNKSLEENFIVLSPSNDYLFDGLGNFETIRLWDFEDAQQNPVNLTLIKEKALKRLRNVVRRNENILVIMPTDESRQCKIYGDCCLRDIRICFFIKPVVENFFGNRLKLVKTINDSTGNTVIKIYEITT